jgi:hypothetical protein
VSSERDGAARKSSRVILVFVSIREGKKNRTLYWRAWGTTKEGTGSKSVRE